MTMADTRGGFTGTGTAGAVVVSNVPALGAGSYCLVAVGISADLPVSSIVASTGTFIRLGQRAEPGGTFRQELWLGYNFGTGLPTTFTVTRAAGVANMVITGRTIDIDGDASIAPSVTLMDNAGVGTSSSGTGALTPPVGAILIAATTMNSITADSTARTHTGNTFWQNVGIELTNVRTEYGWGIAQNAVSTSEVWTLAASPTWVAALASITPGPVPTPVEVKLLKGHTTAAEDAASSY